MKNIKKVNINKTFRFSITLVIFHFDDDLNIISCSDPFSFITCSMTDVNFVCGFQNINNKLMISYSTDDANSFLLKINKEDIKMHSIIIVLNDEINMNSTFFINSNDILNIRQIIDSMINDDLLFCNAILNDTLYNFMSELSKKINKDYIDHFSQLLMFLSEYYQKTGYNKYSYLCRNNKLKYNALKCHIIN